VAAFSLAHFRSRARAPSAKPLSGRQTKPNKSKEIQGNPRKKAWISLDSFGRIVVFQRVTVNPNKKTLFLSGLKRGLSTERWVHRIEVCISWDSGFVQEMPTFGFA
jgi:hypothetical protein